jgi:hypothetical protein
VIANQMITTSSEMAKGLRLLFIVEDDTAKWPFIVLRLFQLVRSQAYL